MDTAGSYVVVSERRGISLVDASDPDDIKVVSRAFSIRPVSDLLVMGNVVYGLDVGGAPVWVDMWQLVAGVSLPRFCGHLRKGA
ncbi:MAG: hypothetical protein GXP49_06570 [Deltaproteobacteria bacterium]|nr:hypothetical protein [Deltaproteobacteria bacterium]